MAYGKNCICTNYYLQYYQRMFKYAMFRIHVIDGNNKDKIFWI